MSVSPSSSQIVPSLEPFPKRGNEDPRSDTADASVFRPFDPPALFRAKTYLGEGESFHVAVRDIFAGPPTCLHTHDYQEVFLVIGGTLEQITPYGIDVLPAGTVGLVRAEHVHGFRTQGEGRIANVLFPASVSNDVAARHGDVLAGRFLWSAAFVPELHRLPPARAARLAAGIEALALAPRHRLRIDGWLTTLIADLMDDAPDPEATAPAWFETACRALRDPAVFRLGAEGLVRAAGRSHAHVCRVCRAATGRTPAALANEARMEHAARLLGAGDAPVDEVARQCGLDNLGHFYRLFRDAHGTTPARYRRAHRAGPFGPPT